MAEHIELDRSFWPVEADKEHDPEAIRIMAALGVGLQVSWDELLENSQNRTFSTDSLSGDRERHDRLAQ